MNPNIIPFVYYIPEMVRHWLRIQYLYKINLRNMSFCGICTIFGKLRNFQMEFLIYIFINGLYIWFADKMLHE